MNGTRSQNHNPDLVMTPKQVKIQQRHRDNIKLILTVIISNVFVGICVSQFYAEAPLTPEPPPKIEDHHLLMHLPLNNLVPLDEGPQKVSLFDADGNMVIYGALLTQALNKAQSFHHEGLYALQIPLDQVQSLIPHQNQTLTAHPFIEKHQSDYASSTRRSYEIVF